MAESLATKYRPRAFMDVIGQERSITILQNQIKNGTTKQGYLFCGSAGTGKTTVARIMATELKAELVEIDAASNNGVDGVRELRENIRFKPMGHELRVYIIDEVHMLSTGAFNALLKTLEEPPSHVVFILCTTDPQKIPATIISRIQRFDFQRVATELIAGRLAHILDMENMCGEEYGCPREELLNVSDNALQYIAKSASGGVRDAISTLDTCLGHDSNLEVADVINILGTVNYDVYFELIATILGKGADSIPVIIEQVFTEGKDLKIFVRRFIDFVCDLEKYCLTANMELLDMPSSYEATLITMQMPCNKFPGIFTSLIDLNRFIQYDKSPKNVITGWLITLCK